MVNAAASVGDAVWRGASCLGCGGTVSVYRDAYVVFNGLPDGSLLFVTRIEPGQYLATRPQVPIGASLYQLGIAHRGCIGQARQRLEGRHVSLPDVLTPIDPVILEDSPVRLDLPPGPDRCPFCEDCTDLNDEDALPLWISRVLVKRHGKLKQRTPHGTRDVMYAKFKVPIGEACNHGWLSVLENDTKKVMEPMIFGPQHGEPPCRTLTNAEQQLLSTWAMKTSLMFDLGTQPQAIPRRLYEQLRLYRCPLPNTVVLLGANRGDSRAVRIAHGGLNLGTVPTGTHDAFMTAITVFRVVFKVIGLLGPSFPQHMSYPSALLDGLHRIWPLPDRDISWPRDGMAFDDQSLIAFEGELPRLDFAAQH
jgi:hypothetical protein